MGQYKGKMECPICHHTSMIVYLNEDNSTRAACHRPDCEVAILEFEDGKQILYDNKNSTEKRLSKPYNLTDMVEESKGSSLELIPPEVIKQIPKTHRCISPSTFSKFRYGGYHSNGTDYEVASIVNESGVVQSQNVRFKVDGKKAFFRCNSPDKDEANYLFGQYSNQTLTMKKMLVITEGELDCMSVYQAYAAKGDWIPFCVSLPGGSGSVSVLADQRHWLNKFEEIYLCFDADEAGQAAVKKAIKILGTDKVKEVKLKSDYKDANGYITAGAWDDLRYAINNATSPAIPCITRKHGILKMLNDAAPPVLPTGVQVLDKILSGGLAYGGLNVIVGGTGLGKSTIAYNAAANVLKSGKKVLVLNTEMKSIEPVLHFMSAYYKTPFYDMYSSCGSTKEEVQQWVNSVIKPKVEEMLKDDNLTFFDGIETTPWSDAFNSIKAHVEADGVSLIVLDNLTGLSESTSSKKQLLDTVLKDLNSLCRQYEVTGLILSHLTKNGGGATNKDGSKSITFETGAEVGLDNIADSSHTSKYGSNILSYERSINDDSGSFILRLLKTRYKGTGRYEKGVYNAKTCTFTDTVFSLEELVIEDEDDLFKE
jgi:RecA/RadA recombinase